MNKNLKKTSIINDGIKNNKLKILLATVLVTTAISGEALGIPSNIGGSNIASATKSSGSIYYHAYLPITSVNDFATGNKMILNSGNYNDLIMSNYVAGVMLGHLINEKFPSLVGRYHKDYLYGEILGQLLQENINTELYSSSSNLIDSSPLQQAVMGIGQGGPYQINSYAYDQIQSGTTALVNYVALQKHIGYTIDQAKAQARKATPLTFNNKYYSPILTAYFHLTDLIINIPNNLADYIATVGKHGDNNNPLDVLVAYSYNQGPWGTLLSDAVSSYDNKSSSYSHFIKKYNSYDNAIGDSYTQYPYQVRYYLDELYNKSTISNTKTNPAVHVVFNMTKLGAVFVNVFSTLAYLKNPHELRTASNYVYIPKATANTAYNHALAKAGVSATSLLDLSNANDRAKIFEVLEVAISDLEKSLKANFTQAVAIQIGVPLPKCPTHPIVYPDKIGTYKGGTIVKGIDEAGNSNLFQCKSDQVADWCNLPAYSPVGIYSSSAWNQYQCRK